MLLARIRKRGFLNERRPLSPDFWTPKTPILKLAECKCKIFPSVIKDRGGGLKRASAKLRR